MTDTTELRKAALTRHMTHEEWRGIRVTSYRWKEAIPLALQGSTWDWAYASHWSTPGAHGNPEALVPVDEAERLVSALLDENTALEERVRVLEGALEPFMRLARAVTVDGSPDFVHWAQEAKDWVVAFSFAGHSINIGQLRALAALQAGESKE